jgi:hypothetical protein
MERFDFEKELLSRPLRGAGFSERLRKRIEEAVDANENARKPRTFAIASFCSVLFLAALVFGIVRFEDPSSDNLYHAAQQTSDAVVETLSATSADPVTPEVRSGLLIGLRSDGPVSDYRTLYIAPKEERLQVAAQGKGVLVPYKQQFWNVDFVKTSSDGDQYVVTYPAQTEFSENPVKLLDSADNTVHREELLFVGNEYVSVIETNTSANPAIDTGPAKRVWTTKIPLLDARSSIRTESRNELKKFTLNDVFGTNEKNPDYATDGWAVGRKQGRWVPLVADNNGLPNMTLRDVNAALPESVANYDQLCCSWADIAAKQPQAIDAFSSPSGDMTVVVTNDRILVYPGSPFRSDSPALAVNLNRNEKVIMAQWATGRYVDEWAEKTKQILQPQ